ncbi:2-hydroxycarboxylate transporter family protein [Companilactobacillus sp. HBUAS59544]|uniref:2-hydroxycarboxylate transporter family protein n=1 Tax=Companilactobacillus sp. HBUAS59544 TaxID=3109363 RepID=UPI002FF1583E
MNDIRIANLKLVYYIPLTIVILIATYMGVLNDDIVGSFAYLFVISGALFYIGGKIPIIGKWFGGAVLLPLFGGSALVYFNLIPQPVIKGVSTLIGSGLINVFLAAIIIGSILSMDRKVLLSSAMRLIPTMLVAQIFVILFLYLSSLVLGIKPLESIFMIGLPNYAGGSSGALAVVPAIYSSFFHKAVGTWSAKFIVYLNISNVICVLFAGLLNQVGKKHPEWTGNGQLLKNTKNDIEKKGSQKKKDQGQDIKSLAGRLGSGFFVSMGFLVAGSIMQAIISQINYIAWAAILVILVKAFGLFDESLCISANEWRIFVQKVFLPIIITGIGISSLDFAQVLSYLRPVNLVVLIMAVVGAMIGSLIMGMLLKMNPIDSMIGIGLQLGNLGGTGAITTLQTSERMNMMPFATIANRLGGAIMLIEISFLLPYFA